MKHLGKFGGSGGGDGYDDRFLDRNQEWNITDIIEQRSWRIAIRVDRGFGFRVERNLSTVRAKLSEKVAGRDQMALGTGCIPYEYLDLLGSQGGSPFEW